MIVLDNVYFSYPQRSPIYIGFDWQVGRGEAWAVLGPSGCGKTTLLYLLAGLQLPTCGTISIDDQIISRPRPETGLILQDYGLLPWATVKENVTLGLRIHAFYGPDGTHAPFSQIEQADAGVWLDRLGLKDLAGNFPGQLSGGQRQRAAIARTLVLRPDLLLMDEPFSSLDAPTRTGLQDLTLQLWQENRFTFVIVTHTIEEAAFLGQKILVLGKPPHSSPRIIENLGFGTPGFRQKKTYLQLCAGLRALLEEG